MVGGVNLHAESPSYTLEGMQTPTTETIRRVQKLFEAEGVKVIL